MPIAVTSTSYQVEKRSWLLGPHGTEPGANATVTIDISALTPATHYPNGYIPSGTVLSKVASGLWTAYDGTNGLEHGLLFSSVKVPNPADTTLDAEGAVVQHGFVDHNKLPAGGKPVIATARTAMPQINFTTTTP